MSMAANNATELKAQPLLPLLIVAMGGALTGTSGIFVRLSETGPIATGAWRLGLAALALAAVMRVKAGQGPSLRVSPILILAGLFFAIDMGFFNWALNMTSVAHATLIANMAPIGALIGGCLLFSERFGAAKALGLVAALGGAAVMTLRGAEGASTISGDIVAIGAMLGYALYLIAVKRARQEYDTLTILFGSSLWASLMMFVVAFMAGEQILPDSMAGWSALIALGLVAHVMGQGLVALGMGGAPVGLGSILLLTQPVVATLSAWAVFGERMGPVEAGGAALVLIGLAVAMRARG